MRVSYLVVAFSLVLAIPASCVIEEPGDLTGIYEGELHFPSHSKTAKALRLTIPQSILTRADEVIQ